mgnify:CR=1 FL=1
MLRFIYICIIFIFLVSCGTKSNLIQSEFENEKKQNSYDACANFSYISLSNDIKYKKIFTEYINLDSSCKWNGVARGYFVSLFMDTIKAKSYKLVEKKEFKNQQQQIKVSASIKEELNALKSITKTKFDYEIIELLIDSYTQHLTPMQRRKFKTMTMSDDEE